MSQRMTAEEYAKLDRVYQLALQLEKAIQETAQFQEWRNNRERRIMDGLREGTIEEDELDGPLGGWGRDIHVTHFTTHTQVKFDDQALEDDREI